MEFKIGDKVIYYKIVNGGVYRPPQKLVGTIVKIGRHMITCEGEYGVFRCYPENVTRVERGTGKS